MDDVALDEAPAGVDSGLEKPHLNYLKLAVFAAATIASWLIVVALSRLVEAL